MGGCKYSEPTIEDVIIEMTSAYRTLSNYLETPDGMPEPVPEIYWQLEKYINEKRRSNHEHIISSRQL